MCQQQICLSNATNIAYAQTAWHVFMGMYANVCSTYEVAPINDVGQNHCTKVSMIRTQGNDDAVAQLHILSCPLCKINEKPIRMFTAHT